MRPINPRVPSTKSRPSRALMPLLMFMLLLLASLNRSMGCFEKALQPMARLRGNWTLSWDPWSGRPRALGANQPMWRKGCQYPPGVRTTRAVCRTALCSITRLTPYRGSGRTQSLSRLRKKRPKLLWGALQISQLLWLLTRGTEAATRPPKQPRKLKTLLTRIVFCTCLLAWYPCTGVPTRIFFFGRVHSFLDLWWRQF